MRIDNDTSRYSVISAVVGAISMFIWLIPTISIFTGIYTIYVGLKGLDSEMNYLSKAGIVMGVISIVLTMLRSGLLSHIL